MEEESMEEEGGSSSSYEAMMDDQNHNNWEAGVDGYRQQQPPVGYAQAPLGDRALQLPVDRKGHRGQQEEEDEVQMVPEANGLMRGCDSAGAAGKGGAVAAATININTSTSKFLMNVITIEDYKSTYWPKLDSAIDQLLTQSPGDYIPISYEQIYSCVYKCVCQQHSEQMYSDLIKKITNHLERVSKELQNKFYIETKLNRDLKDDLIKLFTEHVAEKHIYNLMQWVQMAPALFSKFIPNILPPAVESELQEYAAQDQKLQRELMQNGFTRGDQSRKRAGEELTYNGSSTCASSRGYR
ncbi:CDK2-associated and cullin domain-containing protein 1 isoform X4 [Carettochelys insculpta]|uniref:CDK2-associated and cullin domain-containing protein 1 isoform X4 n=1 Tax=Carettochelys insculpta TaxID=44489 RepID=UPI003EBEB4D0